MRSKVFRRLMRTRGLGRPVLFGSAGLTLLASAAYCQLPTPALQRLPAAQTTEAQPAPAVPFGSVVAAQPVRARVQFTGGQLTLAAQNSSLNAILGEIARLTGLKITGGVADERVYGNYGPDSPQAILNELLEGTGTNMVLLETPQHTLAELILTPRNGGPTPPSPNAARETGDEENSPPSLAGRRRDFPPAERRIPLNQNIRQPGSSQAGLPAQQQPSTPATDSNAPAPADATQPSPNGVKTPREVWLENQGNQQAPTAPPQ